MKQMKQQIARLPSCRSIFRRLQHNTAANHEDFLCQRSTPTVCEDSW